MSGGNTSNRSSGGDEDDGDWGSKFLKVAGAVASAAAIAGGLYSLLTSSSSEQQPPIEARARRVIKEPKDDAGALIPSSPSRWTKPEYGWVKLNVDGSLDHMGDPRSAGCGGVLRDASATWLIGFAQKLNASDDVQVTDTEAVAILKGMELAMEMNIKKLVVETDNEGVVSMVVNGLGNKIRHPQYNIINSIRQLRDQEGWKVDFFHIPREANRVANKLARDARDLPNNNPCKYHFPPPNYAILLREDAQVGVVGYY